MHREDIHCEYPFICVQSIEGRNLIVSLLAPAWKQVNGYESLARAMMRTLSEFALQAHTKMASRDYRGQPLLPENERQRDLINEAKQAMQFLVERQWLDVAKDLQLCLESFEICKNKAPHNAKWITAVVQHLCRSSLYTPF